MFNQVPVSHTIDFEGQKLELQTGLLATQSTASVLGTIGQTTVLAAVVVGREKGMDYFPLQVVYEERLYAAGKIKGSRFVKREGKPTDNAVLTGRMIDRSLRSLFSPHLRCEIQVVITVLSLDEVNPPDTLAVLAASSALCLCGFDKKSDLEIFKNLTFDQKNLPKSPIRERAVALIKIKNTDQFVSFVKPSNTEEIYKDGYFLPGGEIENGENSQMAATRETLEELGIDNLKHIKQLGICQKNMVYENQISQGLEYYELFEIEKEELEKTISSEKDKENWQITLVDIEKLRSNNWDQFNWILDKLEDYLFEQEISEIENLEIWEKFNLEISNQNLANNSTKETTEKITKQTNLQTYITAINSQKVFAGPVSSVRIGHRSEPLGEIWLTKLQTEIAKLEEKSENKNMENFEKLIPIITQISESLDKNNSTDLDFIKQIARTLGQNNPDWAKKFKEIYKSTNKLSKTQIWQNYPTKSTFVTNPSYDAQSKNDLDLVVSGSGQNIVMVECGAKITREEIVANGLDLACQKLEILTKFQTEFIQKCQEFKNM